MNVRPGARSCRIVTMTLIDPSSDDVMRSSMPASQNVWPIVAMSASGGYDVQPLLGAPPGTKKLASITMPPTR
jgi:hypothetical protein